MNTREVINRLKLWGAGMALLSVGGIAYAIVKSLKYARTYRRPFNPETYQEIEGKVLSVEHSNERSDEEQGVYLIVQTPDETLPVHLGPAWYINRQRKLPKAGEKITVKGSRTDYHKQQVMVAAQIQRDSMRLGLRDSDGNPYWYGWTPIK
ncbi:hypothetical protein [Fodinibius salsisoli]|uniref:Magnetosome protein MamS/MamX domain-containing protein n=1 Tax=Fodinibius salsisoli TaxID=2820877 RepID=A0ABT3PIV0_9BACT|nr:hypothetical protein [Fodinibius salsisoli]MCW9705861.1 hypothetical protein [Fodinibius salsisoli]